MQLNLKNPTVQLNGLDLQAVKAIFTAMLVWQKFGMQKLTITSARDGKHKTNSLHYTGKAFDLRTKDVPDAVAMREVLQQRLGHDFDVILEPDHIHVEYDPRS